MISNAVVFGLQNGKIILPHNSANIHFCKTTGGSVRTPSVQCRESGFLQCKSWKQTALAITVVKRMEISILALKRLFLLPYPFHELWIMTQPNLNQRG